MGGRAQRRRDGETRDVGCADDRRRPHGTLSKEYFSCHGDEPFARRGARPRCRAHVLGVGAFRGDGAGAGPDRGIELTPDTTLWRGDGVFLGWTHERLAAAWESLRAAEPEPEPPPDFQQLG